MLLASDHGDIDQAVGEAFEVFHLAITADDGLVGQVAGFAHAVDQHDALEALPGVGFLQHRQEGRQTGAGGQQPEVATAAESLQGEIAVGLLFHQQFPARVFR